MRPVFLAVSALAACAEAPAPSGIARMAGRPMLGTFDVIGTPTGQATTAGETTYTWDMTSTGRTYVPNPTMSVGFVGGMPRGMAGSSNSGAVLGQDVSCRVRITAGSDSLIRHWDFSGPQAACDKVTRRLKDGANNRG
jgi:hypothetical protein